MSDADNIISIRNVGKSFGAYEAIGDVSLDIRRGEFVSLLGPSGCGKSTILRMIAGFETPTRGQILIDNVDVWGMPANQRPVNMVFQSYALFPHLSIHDNVAFGLRRKGVRERRQLTKGGVDDEVRKYLALVGLQGFEERFPKQLSGGQQQRTALARALINQPKVLLLDEPLGALDLQLRKRMQIELKQLQRELGISFVFVTHDQEEALSLSDRIAVMNRGELLQYGPGRAIYDEPATAFVASFLGDANVLQGKVLAGEGVVGIAEQSTRFLAQDFQVAKPGDPICLSIRPENIRVAEPSPRDGSLQGRLVDKVFLGSSFLIQVDVAPDIVLSVKGTDRAVFDGLPLGGMVTLSWPLDAARVVRP